MSHKPKGQVLVSVLTCVGIFIASALITSAVVIKRRQMQNIPVPLKTQEMQMFPSPDEDMAEFLNQPPEPLKTGDRNGLLFCGIDHTRALADVILYAQLDLTNKTVRVLQIPRDLFVGTQYTSGKINSACLPFDSPDPVRKIKNIVTTQLGLPVDGTAAITLAGVRALVDAIGGVTVELERPITFLPGKALAAGTQTLNGEQAEWLLRYRKGYEMGDLDRLKVQQQFLFAAAQSAKNLGRIKALKIAAQNFGHIKTTIPFSEIRSLIELGMGLSTDCIDIETLPVYGADYNGYSVLCINRFKLAELLNSGVRADNPVNPWSLNLAYPPEQPKQNSSIIVQQDDSQFDFSWNFESNDNYDYNADGVIIRQNN